MVVVLVLALLAVVLAGLVVLLASFGTVIHVERGASWSSQLNQNFFPVDTIEIHFGKYYIEVAVGRWCE